VPDDGRSDAEDRRRRDQLLRRAAQASGESQPGAGPRADPAFGRAAGPPDARKSGSTDRLRPTSSRAAQGASIVPPHPSRVDLHAHSCRSDGVLEPLDLVGEAAAAGVQVLALSDHDTLAGVRELVAPGSPVLPLELLPAVEINSVAVGIPQLWEGELHILGLGVDISDDFFEATLDHQRGSRLTRFNRIVDRLRQLGFPIDEEADRLLAGQGAERGASLGRPQIARCLVAARFASSVNDAMQRLLARGKPAYVPREGLGPAEAISAIRAAGGLPSLAHFADAYVRRDLVQELAGFGLGGLEVHYRHFDAETISDLAAVAAEVHLVPTGGSDYHGDTETYAEAHASLYVPDEDATNLYSLLGRRRLTIRTEASLA
jgi:predicted metal-dependent phosphoesterase TrpH